MALTRPIIIGEHDNTIDVDVVRQNVLSSLTSQSSKFTPIHMNRSEMYVSSIKIKLEESDFLSMMGWLDDAENNPLLQKVWELLGPLTLEVYTPTEFFSSGIFIPVGKARKKQFYDGMGWRYNLIEGLDISVQDKISLSGVIRTNSGVVLNSFRVISTAGVPLKDESFTYIFETQESLAFKDLRGSKEDPTFELLSSIGESHPNELFQIYNAAAEGNLGSVERLTNVTPQELESILIEALDSKYGTFSYTNNEFKDISTGVSMSILFMSFAFLTAISIKNRQNLSIVQNNDIFYRVLEGNLGLGIKKLATSIQTRIKKGLPVPDRCHTSLLNFQDCLAYTAKYNPPLYRLTINLLEGMGR